MVGLATSKGRFPAPIGLEPFDHKAPWNKKIDGFLEVFNKFHEGRSDMGIHMVNFVVRDNKIHVLLADDAQTRNVELYMKEAGAARYVYGYERIMAKLPGTFYWFQFTINAGGTISFGYMKAGCYNSKGELLQNFLPNCYDGHYGSYNRDIVVCSWHNAPRWNGDGIHTRDVDPDSFFKAMMAYMSSLWDTSFRYDGAAVTGAMVKAIADQTGVNPKTHARAGFGGAGMGIMMKIIELAGKHDIDWDKIPLAVAEDSLNKTFRTNGRKKLIYTPATVRKYITSSYK